ncbi:MAG: diphosphomevalonate decarboxylase [Candidatus Micrarchaeota archaeon]|nr:diphosphomevalonate decarboxylase [Candidatus Micrarchaeota archaeon]
MKVKAPTNIAVLKYWGKHPLWEEYHIPNKSSLSFTVEGLYTETELEVEKGNGEIRFELNGREITPDMPEFEYVGKFLKKVFKIVPELKHYNYYVKSHNNFPTAAGYASSASGFAALAKALQVTFRELEPQVYQKYLADERKLSVFARLGSGSATRSIPEQGGFVAWWRGLDPHYPYGPEEVTPATFEKNLFASYAESLFPPEHWSDLRIIYTHVEKKEKKIKSRAGMKQTVKTNPVYWSWVDYDEYVLAPKLVEAVRGKDFSTFAEVAIQASDGLHAMMYYTYPRIRYLNDTSEAIIEKILELNQEETKAAYTFDAGPNAIVFTLAPYENEVLSSLKEVVEDVYVTRPGKGPEVIE